MFFNALRSPSFSHYHPSLKGAGLLLCCLLSIGCNLQTSTPNINPPTSQYVLPATILTHLLAGEFALQRGHNKQAAKQLLSVAASTDDLDTTKRATFAAQYSQDPDLLNQTSRLWSQLAPTDPTPWQYLAQAQALQGRFDNAAVSLQHELQHGGGNGLAYVASLSISSSEHALLTLYNHYISWLEQYPKNQHLLYALALLEQAKNQPKAAIMFVKKALDQDQNDLQAQVLYGKLLLVTQEVWAANQYLNQLTQALTQSPPQLIALHAQVLILAVDYQRAYQYFNELTRRFPRDLSFQYSAGLLAYEIDSYGQVARHLQQVLKLEPNRHSAYYYLGLSAIKQGKKSTAIKYFKQVILGPERLAAIAELVNLQQPDLDHIETYFSALRKIHKDLSADLYNLQAEYLLELDHREMASIVYAAGISSYPQHITLLYGRAMMAQTLNDFILTEQLLERILAIEPTHINALNALGYTYAEQCIKLTLAETLIKKALEQAPDNAAIIDSLGWVTYRQGHLKQAKAILSKAYAILPDAEIAAHLGLVEQALGDTKGTFKTWNKALAKVPATCLSNKP